MEFQIMKTHSLNNLAESFEVDRSTMVRALKNTLPDAEVTFGRPTWKISTAASALEQHRRRTGNSVGKTDSTSNPIDQIEADFEAFDAGFARLQAEPNLELRRQLDKQLGVGALIGSLDRQMKTANATIGEERGLSACASDKLIADLISRYLTLLDYWPTDPAK